MESGAGDLLGEEWLLYWTSRDAVVPREFLPKLDEWAVIDSRERALSIEPGTPVLIDPAGRVDARPAYFLRRSKFGFLAEESKRAYAKDYRLFFTFLPHREKYWEDADYGEIDDYESWRHRSPDNPRRIGGNKWARELAAFKLLYGWAVAVGHMNRSPVLTHTVRRRDGTVVEIANNQPKDVRNPCSITLAGNMKRHRSRCGRCRSSRDEVRLWPSSLRGRRRRLRTGRRVARGCCRR
ncbi:site-specific integrase [Nocardia arizonensis]|uniref:site-specific integrase n=1 Tax=Nocardia arizonensis TaxID=1141647 RepID=UPI000AE828FB|nr:site-specific integrase [Nocardia arizonensis]